MVKKLQRRIAFTLAGILTLIMLGIQIFQYASNYYYYVDYQKGMMEDIADGFLYIGTSGKDEVIVTGHEDAEWPLGESGEGNSTGILGITDEGDEINYWHLPIWVFQVGAGNSLSLTQKNAQTTYSEDTVKEKAREILNLNQKEGAYNNIWYLHKDDVLVMIDDKENLNYYKNQALFFIISGCAGFLFILACSLLLARWLVEPAARAFQQQKQFISDASHELKTPLAVIGANAQRLQGEIGDNKWLDYILDENKRMGKLLKELLTLARVEGSPGKDTFESVNLSKVVTGALLPYESIAYEKEVEFWMDIQDDISILGEEEHLKQAVIILTDNAFHNVSEHGEIKVKLYRRGKRIEILVTNTGLEIPNEERQKIFQRFYRVDKGRSRSENRYGLGLAIASGIVSRHKGKIEVESENGRTSFTIFLPVSRYKKG